MNTSKGITLIALVVSIIVMLILAGVSLNMTIGENGIITQSQKASFIAEMTQLQESVDMKRIGRIAEDLEESTTNPLFDENIGSDFSKMPLTLIAEIMYTRNGMDAGTGKDADEILQDRKEQARVENFRLFGGNSKSIYYIDIDTAGGKEKTYVYDAQTRICYKVEGAKYGGHIFHSLIWSDIVINNDTTFVQNGLVMVAGMTSVNGACAYEPDMTGFTSGTSTNPKTYMVYYSNDGTAHLKPLSDYVEGRPREFEGGVLYDYTNKMWANIKCVGRNEKGIEMETWWTWIPRYAYKLDSSTHKTTVQFVNTSDKIVNEDETTSDLPEGYTVHSAFNQNGKALKGIWVAKYPVSKNESSEKTIAPNFEGFVATETNTYVLAFSNDGRYYVEIPLATYNTIFENVEEDNYEIRKVKVQTTDGNNLGTLSTFAKNKGITADNIGTNLTTVTNVVSSSESKGEEFFIYNYSKKLWANIKNVNIANGATSYWVWIPRYAYYLENNQTEVMFVDTNDKPVDGDEVYGLPSMYTVHSAFNQNGDKLRGIWVAKYPVSSTEYPKVSNIKNAAEPNLNDSKVSSALASSDQVTITYYSEDGKESTTKAYNTSSLGTSGSYSLSGISSTISVTNSYGANKTYSMYKYDKGVPFVISIRNATTKTSTSYTWWPRYADNGNKREYLTTTATPSSGYTLGSDFASEDGKTGVWK